MMQLSNFGYFPNWNLTHIALRTNTLKIQPDSLSSPFFLHRFSYTFCCFYETRPLLPLCCFPCSLPPLLAGINWHPAWLQHFSSCSLLPICSWGLTCSSSDPRRLYLLVKTKQKNRDESWKWVDDHKRERQI